MSRNKIFFRISAAFLALIANPLAGHAKDFPLQRTSDISQADLLTKKDALSKATDAQKKDLLDSCMHRYNGYFESMGCNLESASPGHSTLRCSVDCHVASEAELSRLKLENIRLSDEVNLLEADLKGCLPKEQRVKDAITRLQLVQAQQKDGKIGKLVDHVKIIMLDHEAYMDEDAFKNLGLQQMKYANIAREYSSPEWTRDDHLRKSCLSTPICAISKDALHSAITELSDANRGCQQETALLKGKLAEVQVEVRENSNESLNQRKSANSASVAASLPEKSVLKLNTANAAF